MARIDIESRKIAERAFRNGKSIREVAQIARISKGTAEALRKKFDANKKLTEQ